MGLWGACFLNCHIVRSLHFRLCAPAVLQIFALLARQLPKLVQATSNDKLKCLVVAVPAGSQIRFREGVIGHPTFQKFTLPPPKARICSVNVRNCFSKTSMAGYNGYIGDDS